MLCLVVVVVVAPCAPVDHCACFDKLQMASKGSRRKRYLRHLY